MPGSIADAWEAEKPALMPLPKQPLMAVCGPPQTGRATEWRTIRGNAQSLPKIAGSDDEKAGGDREMVDILSLVLHHDEQVVLCAVEMALEAGVQTKIHVLNLLHRLVDGKPTDQGDVTPPSALALNKEPEANVSRYDRLRQGGTGHAS